LIDGSHLEISVSQRGETGLNPDFPVIGREGLLTEYHVEIEGSEREDVEKGFLAGDPGRTENHQHGEQDPAAGLGWDTETRPAPPVQHALPDPRSLYPSAASTPFANPQRAENKTDGVA
jgi:hypothetical protein